MKKMIKQTLAASLLAALSLVSHAEAAVSRDQRALVVISELDEHGIQEIRPLYTVIEALTVNMPQALFASYGRIETLTNREVTVGNIRARIMSLTNNPSIKAVDVIFAVHGSDERVALFDRQVTMASFRDAMIASPDARMAAMVSTMKKKLRFMYNLSCFGETHRGEFRSMGFDIVVGAKAVNANAEVEYPSVLALWTAGANVGAAFAPTNHPAALLVTDGPLRTLGNIQGNFLRQVNSEKLFNGDKNIKISSDAQ